MKRLYKETLDKVLTYLYILRYTTGEVKQSEIAGYITNIQSKYPDVKHFARMIPKDEAIPMESVSEMIDLLIKVRNSEEQEDLIDVIVKTLQMPFVRNAFAGTTLNMLKKALLLPNEIGAMRAKIAAGELHCANCGRQFKDYEMVNIRPNKDGSSLHCMKCTHPELTACTHCETGHAEVSAKYYNAIKKMKCPSCHRKANGIEEPAEVPDVRDDAFEGFRTRLTRNATAGNIPTPVPSVEHLVNHVSAADIATQAGIHRFYQRILESVRTYPITQTTIRHLDLVDTVLLPQMQRVNPGLDSIISYLDRNGVHIARFRAPAANTAEARLDNQPPQVDNWRPMPTPARPQFRPAPVQGNGGTWVHTVVTDGDE